MCLYFLKDAFGDTPLHDAIQAGNDSGAAFLVAHPRTKFNLSNKKGHTPLTQAAMKNDEL